MPRRKGHGIPPTKRVKLPDAITRSAPLKNKLYNEIPILNAKEEPIQMTVNTVPIKSEPPSIINDALHSKYLHKKFKKMASTLLSEESNNQLNTIWNGKTLKHSRIALSPEYLSESEKVRSSQASSPKSEASLNNSRVISPPTGRYVCSYCKLACAKPSVLQKHIRAHTNERPYPCLPCGFAFKTKSNLYKHCRSRAHASKLEESGEKMTMMFDGEDGGSSEEEDSLMGSPTATSLGSRSEIDVESRDDLPKSIYKPKYRFMEPLKSHLSEKSDERKENSTSPPRLHLKIPVPNTTPPNSTPSPFTSGSSPSPEFIHRHINKLISENQAIVETNDPFWTKKYMQRTNSTDNSCSSPLSTSPSPTDSIIKRSVKHSVNLDLTEDGNCDKLVPKHSKLALALLKPQSSVSPKFSNPSPTEPCDSQPLNLSTTNKEQSVASQRKRSNSEGIPENPSKLFKDKLNSIPLKLHNQSVQDFRRLASTLSETSASILLNHLDNKKVVDGTNERSIIKDLLLKARSSGTTAVINRSGVELEFKNKTVSPLSPAVSDDRAYSPSSQFMCHLCKDPIAYETPEHLELHLLYHCKNNDSSTTISLNNLSSQTEIQQSEYLQYLKAAPKSGPLLIAPSQPSPGPLLGNTPLIESYYTKSPVSPHSSPTTLKKRKFDTGIVEKRVISATTLRSLEELSKSPMRSNLQMFGGEVKIVDNSSGEAKTLRIEPTNRNLSKTPSEISLQVSHQPCKNELNDESCLQKANSNVVVTISKPGLHSSGAIVQFPQNASNEQKSSHQLPVSKNVTATTPISRPTYTEPNKIRFPVIPNVTPNISLASFVPFTSILPESTVINPLTNITAYNPLTLPPAAVLSPNSPGIPSMYSSGIVTILHGGKEIPYVPGMPGPHTLLPNHSAPICSSKVDSDSREVKLLETKSNNQQSQIKNNKIDAILPIKKKPSSLNLPTIQVNSEKVDSPVENSGSVLRKRSFEEGSGPFIPSPKASTPKRSQLFSLPSEPEDTLESSPEQKFLRPTSLPLKPGTFVPKRQQLTPVLSLVSPETPRPRKSYGQLYLNGHAYTYLGLKCSTRMFFCTLNKPQPIYVPLSPEHNKVSMYSNWKVCTETDPNPCNLDPGRAMALYDSRHRPTIYTLAQSRNFEAITHSTYWTNRTQPYNQHQKEEIAENVPKRVKIFAGGFESNEDYIYVRGRGRGRYVCEECGIRCKKPSMLKKHIRTHTDVRPFTCVHCKFSFKTKGNLTKHMKSKAHYKKCVSLGISPVPTAVDDSNIDEEALARQQALRKTQGIGPEESEEDDEDEEEDDTDEEEDEEEADVEMESVGEEEDIQSHVEHEAARSLLTLSETLQSVTQRQHANAGLVAVSARPNTYPYSFTQVSETQPQTPTLTSISAQREREKVLQNTGLAREVQVEVTAKGTVDESKGETLEKGVTARFYFPSSHDLGNSAEESPEVQKQSRPIDLSNKTSDKTSPRVCEAAMLLATLCSTMERLPIPVTSTAENEHSVLLQAYLTERAVQDSRMKQHQYKLKASTIELADHRVKTVTVSVPGPGPDISAAKENALGILAQTSSDARRLPTSELHTTNKPQAEFLPPSSGPSPSYVSVLEDGRSMCNICNKIFSKPSQLRLHVNIHYFERPFRCESCAVSFRTKGHLQKHQRSVSHLNKVNMNSTFGTATTSNPRPFKCDDCKIAFRIHGHLAKHLRSKMHIMKLECLGKLPFGTYAELERSGINMNDIDTTDCENSLESLQLLAQKLYEKDPSKLGQWDPAEIPHHALSSGDTSSEGEDEDMPAPLPLAAEQLMLSPVQRLQPPVLQKPSLSTVPSSADIQSSSVTTNFKGPKHKISERPDESAQVSKTEVVESVNNRRTDKPSDC